MTSKSFFGKLFKPGVGSGYTAGRGVGQIAAGAKTAVQGAGNLFKSQPLAAKITEGGVATYLAADHLYKKQQDKQSRNYLNPYQL